MVSEFIVGRHSQANAARAYGTLTNRKGWGFIGLLGILTSTIILGFYSVVAGWCLQYLGTSAVGGLKGDSTYVQQYFQMFSGDPVKRLSNLIIMIPFADKVAAAVHDTAREIAVDAADLYIVIEQFRRRTHHPDKLKVERQLVCQFGKRVSYHMITVSCRMVMRVFRLLDKNLYYPLRQ